jgi:hypothetical protein
MFVPIVAAIAIAGLVRLRNGRQEENGLSR